ncbi:MAG: 4-alpha-glucanotransferase [Granulosicoccus sp.]|nr:4-alpha-glucanotransferase [Granulosicoccus sp.]
MDELIKRLSSHYGIASEYTDLAGVVRPTSIDTQRALLRANGVEPDAAGLAQVEHDLLNNKPVDGLPDDLVVQSHQPYTVKLDKNLEWQLTTTDDPQYAASGRANGSLELPPLEPGVYELKLRIKHLEQSIVVIATPARCPMLPENTPLARHWGINAALYGLSSDRNLGVGDYVDLQSLARAAGQSGASFIGLNPVHALGLGNCDVISPYSPSHRSMLDTQAIALDAIPGLEDNERAQAVIGQARVRSRKSAETAFIDYPGQRRALQSGLEALYQIFREEAGADAREGFSGFQCSVSPTQYNYSLYEAIAHYHGSDWTRWPDGLRLRDLTTLDTFAEQHRELRNFCLWTQWVASVQLSKAAEVATDSGLSLGLYLDFAVGSRRIGAESWCEMDSTATGISIGAPPDHLSPAGQNWELSGFSPQKLQRQSYRPYQLMLRAVMQQARMLRLDHVLGLNRIFWIPDDGSPGAYIKQPFASLLAIVKIEAQRAGTIIIGEDLGLVPDGFRETIREAGFYGYSVLQFEKNKKHEFTDPALNPRQTLACFGTHDTPTIRGFSRGRDIDWWLKLGWIDQAQAKDAQKRRLLELDALYRLTDQVRADTTQTAESRKLIDLIHRLLADSGSALVTLQLDDLLEIEEAQNLPGTVDEHPNWRRRYPVSVDQLQDKLTSLTRVMQSRSSDSHRT